MTDWNMVVETFPNGRAQLSASSRRAKTPRRAEPLHDDASRRVLARRRPVHLRRSRHAVEHRRAATSTSQLYRPPIATNDYRGRAVVLERHRQDPVVRAVPRRHAVALHDRRRQGRTSTASTSRATAPRSAVTGDVDLARWPEQIYQIKSQIDFPTQKDIFFHRETLHARRAQGDFDGTFHLFKGGRELKGTFTSPVAGVNDWRFPNLRGSVLWLPDGSRSPTPRSGVYGGTARFDYRMAPFGKPGVPTRATWDVEYTRRRPRAADRLSRDAGHAAGRPRHGREPARVAARQVGR